MFLKLLIVKILLFYLFEYIFQTSLNTSDGGKFVDFYNVTTYPHLAIIDPRTGECIRSYSSITVDSIVADLNDMLSSHASPESIAIDHTRENRSAMASFDQVKIGSRHSVSPMSKVKIF